jgi:hypothetical protein
MILPRALKTLQCAALLLALTLPHVSHSTPLSSPLIDSVELMSQAEQIAHTGALAERCGMDEPSLVARQTGIQLSANLLLATYPEESATALELFSGAVLKSRDTYDRSSDVQKSRLCAMAWLDWRSTRKASSLATSVPDLVETVDMAHDAGNIHGWLWRCRRRAGLEDSPSKDIVKQAALSLALAALSSSSIDDLLSAQSGWAKGFSDSLADESLDDSQCGALSKSLPKLSKSFDRRSDFIPALRRAKANKTQNLGLRL